MRPGTVGECGDGWRLALFASAAALFVFAQFDAASAQFGDRLFRNTPPRDIRYAPPRDSQIRKANRPPATQSKRDVPIRHPFGENMPKGPLQLVIVISDQKAILYSNGVRVGDTRVSTGTASHPTPTGVFSIIQKNCWHRSNLYGSAPMFYMHRLTWSGVALHEGHLPGYAASHGCIRMPTDFVSRLWNVSKMGMRVVVVRTEVAPREFSHAKLFNPAQKPPEPRVSRLIDGLRPAIDAAGPGSFVQVAEAQPMPANAATASDAPDAAATDTASIEAPPPPAFAEPITAATVTTAPATAAADPVRSEIDLNELRLPRPAPLRTRSAEPTKLNGQVAVFISRKEKRIFVRHAFVPLFDMPVEIASPEKPFGTHTYTALQVTDGRMRWNVISLAPAGPQPVRGRSKNAPPPPKHAKGKAAPQPVAAPAIAFSDASEALDRVTIPQEAIDRIAELLIPGSSLVISDEGLGRETGRYTEFIVETRH